MSRSALPLALLLVAGACATTPPAPPPPSASHAWATFDAKGITASGAAGLADRATGRRVTIDDPVRIASITKLHVALGIMRLVEQGKLDLDRDVSDYLGWRVRNPAFPDAPITLRLLLSHRSSMRDGIDYWLIPATARLQDPLADPKAWDPEHRPGTYFQYSNLAFPVVGSVMEAVTRERLDRLMQRLVFAPLKLEACLNWSTCSDESVARAVVLYAPDGSVRRDDLRGKRPDCPGTPDARGGCDLSGYKPGTNGAIYSPQGGLRISVSDLAKVGQMLLGRGRLPNGSRFLREASLAEMERLHWRFDGSNGATEENFYCGYGLATQLTAQCSPHDDPFGDGKARVGHAGEAYGLRSAFWIDRKRGTGIAYFATGLGPDPAKGRSAYRAVEEWLAARGR
ncbi:MAG TPA: serine hydrolase domain-containing protein [Allosphingosinicella sp.]|jgi:CubicO group peptidase (beta-lactamase class C family)